MARKVKIPNHIQKRLERKGNKRKRNTIPKRKYFLIVCEGEKTEPNYFESLKQDLPKGVLTSCRIDIEGTGRNTLSLVRESERIKKRLEDETNLAIDKIWVVFDRDSFSAENFNEAINYCKQSKPEIGSAWTNEAFELWYLLPIIITHQLPEKGIKNLLKEIYNLKSGLITDMRKTAQRCMKFSKKMEALN